MFTGELAESRQTEVVIRDIDERAMELLIDFAYTSQVTETAAAEFPTKCGNYLLIALQFDCLLIYIFAIKKKCKLGKMFLTCLDI